MSRLVRVGLFICVYEYVPYIYSCGFSSTGRAERAGCAAQHLDCKVDFTLFNNHTRCTQANAKYITATMAAVKINPQNISATRICFWVNLNSGVHTEAKLR